MEIDEWNRSNNVETKFEQRRQLSWQSWARRPWGEKNAIKTFKLNNFEIRTWSSFEARTRKTPLPLFKRWNVKQPIQTNKSRRNFLGEKQYDKESNQEIFPFVINLTTKIKKNWKEQAAIKIQTYSITSVAVSFPETWDPMSPGDESFTHLLEGLKKALKNWTFAL